MRNLLSPIATILLCAVSLHAQTKVSILPLILPLSAAIPGGLGNPALTPRTQVLSLINASALTPSVMPAPAVVVPIGKKTAPLTAKKSLLNSDSKDEPQAAASAAFDGTAAKLARGVSTDWVRSMIEKDEAVDGQTRRLRDVVQRMGFAQTALNGGVPKAVEIVVAFG